MSGKSIIGRKYSAVMKSVATISISQYLRLNSLYLPANRFNEQLNQYPRVIVSARGELATSQTQAAMEDNSSDNQKVQGLVTLSAQEPPQLSVNHQKSEPLADLLAFLETQSQTATPVLIVAETAGRREILIELFKGKIETKA